MKYAVTSYPFLKWDKIEIHTGVLVFPLTLQVTILCPHFKGTAPPTPKLAYFVLYLKIINTFLKNTGNLCILK